MGNKFNHILTTSGVLAAFNISKKINSDEITKFIKKHKADCSTKFELQELLKNEMFEHTREYLNGHGIPGLIPPTKSEADIIENDAGELKDEPNVIKKRYKIKDKKFIKVREDAGKLSNMLKNTKNLSRDELLFFVISLVEFLELSDEHFEDFHERLDDSDGFSDQDDESDNDDDYGDTINGE